ncbi:TIM barrel protein [bacterium]|nr:TIM barrel protein [bacterium]
MTQNKLATNRITYNYAGIEKRTRNSALRFLFAKLGVQFLKSLFKFLPGIDNSIYQKGDNKEFYVEIVPSFLGMFSKHWEIKEKSVERFVELGVAVRSMHAPWIDDGKVFQTARKSFLENVLDVTDYSSTTLLCLYSHLHLYDLIAPKEQDKVLIVHPIPSSPYKTEKEIIKSITKVVKKILPMLRDQNVKLVIENMPWMKKKHERYTTSLGDALFFDKLMNEVPDPYYGVLFDWGHANTYARFMYTHGITHREHEFTSESLARFEYQNYFIHRLHDKIMYGHLNFNEAHDLLAKPPFYARNFDAHADLTHMNEQEYEYYKKNMQALGNVPHLVGMTIESIPSYTSRIKRIQRYKDSVEILNSMLQSHS